MPTYFLLQCNIGDQEATQNCYYRSVNGTFTLFIERLVHRLTKTEPFIIITLTRSVSSGTKNPARQSIFIQKYGKTGPYSFLLDNTDLICGKIFKNAHTWFIIIFSARLMSKKQTHV